MNWYLFYEHLDHLREVATGLFCDIERTLVSLRAPRRWSRQPSFAEQIGKKLDGLLDEVESLRGKLLTTLSMGDALSIPGDEQWAVRCMKDKAKLQLHLQEYATLSEVIAQRWPQLDGADLNVMNDNQQDLAGRGMLFRAADAVTLDYWDQIYGREWIKKQAAWPPLTLFTGQRSYAVNIRHQVVYIPIPDLYRTRMWPALAHEIAHGKVDSLFRVDHAETSVLGRFVQKTGAAYEPSDLKLTNPDRLRALVRDGSVQTVRRMVQHYSREVDKIEEIHKRILKGKVPDDSRAIASQQFNELLADSIAVSIAGPAFLLAFLSLSIGDVSTLFAYQENKDEARVDEYAREWAAKMDHPPEIVRIRSIARTLQAIGTDTLLPSGYLEQYYTAYEARWAKAKYDVFVDVLEEWQGFDESCEEALREITHWLVAGRRFDHSDVKMLESDIDPAAVCGREPDWRPSHLINLGWKKRVDVARNARAVLNSAGRESDVMSAIHGPNIGMFGSLIHGMVVWGDRQLSLLSENRK